MLATLRNHYPHSITLQNHRISISIPSNSQGTINIIPEGEVFEILFEDIVMRDPLYINPGECWSIGVVLATRKYSEVRSYTSDMSAIHVQNSGYVPGFVSITPKGCQPRPVAFLQGSDGKSFIGGSKSSFFINETIRAGDIISFSYVLKDRTYVIHTHISDDVFKDYEICAVTKCGVANTSRENFAPRVANFVKYK